MLSEIAHPGFLSCDHLSTVPIAVDAQWRLPPHAHPFHEMIVVARGRMCVEMQGVSLRAEPGDILFYPADTLHEEWAQGSTPLLTTCLAFRWQGWTPRPPCVVRDRLGRLQEMAAWLCAENDAYFSEAPAFRQILLAAILAEYVRLSDDTEHEVVDRARAYVRAHLDASFSLDDLAAAAGLSKFYFARAYKALTGMSPMRDARRIRIEEARKLIVTTSLGLKQIAPRVGLGNEYHLSRLLKKHLGAGSRELRQRPRA
ncbi:MAG TPA: AraC family transcriptional regulator [Candidatus Hydrogenedentes bacterium]|nr:AraC family transcriptional regulator [Candidatus Hydrogenedentota bacterium]HOS02613.1 AraC family transcriptional regulator [Candidatus Hydrogenedentota bacterium]